jgi:glycerophosphoryl diester phosphodiesterase
MGCKIDHEYTPMTIDDLINLLNQYKDVYVLLDTKTTDVNITGKQYKAIYRAASKVDVKILDRMLPSIYDKNMYPVIKDVYDFKNIIYSLYLNNEKDDDVLNFAVKNNIRAVSLNGVRGNKEFISELNANHIFVYAHTIDSLDEANKFKDMGAHGIITNFLSPDGN